jgi:hypothetical protein
MCEKRSGCAKASRQGVDNEDGMTGKIVISGLSEWFGSGIVRGIDRRESHV